MSAPAGFEYVVRGDGTVVISHHGRDVTVLRGARAEQFLEDAAADPQRAMARWSGNYKRGNERAARQHPRNG